MSYVITFTTSIWPHRSLEQEEQNRLVSNHSKQKIYESSLCKNVQVISASKRWNMNVCVGCNFCRLFCTLSKTQTGNAHHAHVSAARNFLLKDKGSISNTSINLKRCPGVPLGSSSLKKLAEEISVEYRRQKVYFFPLSMAIQRG